MVRCISSASQMGGLKHKGGGRGQGWDSNPGLADFLSCPGDCTALPSSGA